jgi:ABC-type branched-subunit amino acid transport system substrate-binding protein
VNIHQAHPVADDWDEVKAELSRAFQMAQEAARAEESFVFVVHHDDLLGRRGTGNAMVATGLLSAARTAAIEGSRKGWTANVVAFDDDANPELVREWAERLAEDPSGVTGELIRLGPSHLGKALP